MQLNKKRIAWKESIMILYITIDTIYTFYKVLLTTFIIYAQYNNYKFIYILLFIIS